ncbi:MAG TPA: hypothetical protein VFG01_09735, partial [Acidobacteriota bacterium]|nr:hypothetical protein [Acidobacteriota bacterium]
LSGAELGACLTHGRGELRSSREHSAKNGVKNLKGAQAISEFHFYLTIETHTSIVFFQIQNQTKGNFHG